MPRFQTRRYEQIIVDMIARMVTRTALSDVADSSVWKHLLAAAAQEDDEIYYQMSLLLKLFSVDEAKGDDLDERAAEIQPGLISRYEATKASGNLIFSRSGTTGDVTIALGTKVKTAGGEIFSTTVAGQILDGNQDSASIAAVADVPGEAGNAAADTIVKFVQKPTGVDSVTNPSAFAYGTDKETDDAFRNRLKAYIRALPRSTVDSLENGVLGATDENTGATILFSKAVEDIVQRGDVKLYVDDGTGSAEASTETSGTDIAATLTWDTTTTITTSDTSEVAVDDFIGLRTDRQVFRVISLITDTSITIENPGSPPLSIPAGSTTSFKNPENMTEGLGGGNGDAAVGGEEYLNLLNIPVKDSVTYYVISSLRGILVEDTDYYINPASGQVNFITALSADEYVFAWYTYYTGLIALAQKIVDGDLNDRENYPGLRAAGVYVQVLTPAVLYQNIDVDITVLGGYDETSVETDVIEAIKGYVNSLGISGDMLRSELIKRIMSVSGVYNAIITSPTSDVVLLDDQMARTTDDNISIN